MATFEEHLIFSDFAYRKDNFIKPLAVSEKSPNDIVGGKPPLAKVDPAWIVFDSDVDGASGFKGVAFYNKATHEMVISIAGTEPTQVYDGHIPDLDTADAWLATGYIQDQYFKTIDFIEKVKNKAVLEGFIISHTSLDGHSLGGNNVQLAGAKTGYETVAFNPAGADINYINSVFLFNSSPQYAISGQSSYPNITNYIVRTDITGNAFPHLGQTFYIDPNLNLFQFTINTALNGFFLGAGSLYFYAIQSHDLKNFVGRSPSDFTSDRGATSHAIEDSTKAFINTSIPDNTLRFADLVVKQIKEITGLLPASDQYSMRNAEPNIAILGTQAKLYNASTATKGSSDKPVELNKNAAIRGAVSTQSNDAASGQPSIAPAASAGQTYYLVKYGNKTKKLTKSEYDKVKNILGTLVGTQSPGGGTPNQSIISLPGTSSVTGSIVRANYPLVRANYPLILDMDGDGVEAIAYENSHATFDFMGYGFAGKTSWVSKAA